MFTTRRGRRRLARSSSRKRARGRQARARRGRFASLRGRWRLAHDGANRRGRRICSSHGTGLEPRRRAGLRPNRRWRRLRRHRERLVLVRAWYRRRTRNPIPSHGLKDIGPSFARRKQHRWLETLKNVFIWGNWQPRLNRKHCSGSIPLPRMRHFRLPIANGAPLLRPRVPLSRSPRPKGVDNTRGLEIASSTFRFRGG